MQIQGVDNIPLPFGKIAENIGEKFFVQQVVNIGVSADRKAFGCIQISQQIICRHRNICAWIRPVQQLKMKLLLDKSGQQVVLIALVALESI